ncbi:lanosterol 14-alpha-demethylase [Crucibulum laeve]|uniref:Lanosterol 14-alpha-demethylase n=1 Tax=Crucibulum laeve TaxID=68775 RepID=A0A5C3LJ94_9AGAR|nr:lanosterol 14-alpha-demethylase [Crucibulum laeve]
MSSKLSFGMYNGTVPSAEDWSGYIAHAQTFIPENKRLFLLLLVNLPVIAILFNVLPQVIIPRNPSDPPVVFHWLPFVGSAIQYGNNPLQFFLECREKGNNFVLGGKSTVFSAEDAYKHVTTPVFGKDVVYDIPNEKFMEQKKFVKVGLSMDNLRAYVGMIEDEVDDFLANDPAFEAFQKNEAGKEWSTFDVVKVLQEITILTAAKTLQGKEVRGNMDKNFAVTYNDLDGGFTPLNFMFPHLPLESYRKRDRAQKKMSDFYVNIIKKRKSGGSDHEQDMIATLMAQRYRSGEPVKDHEVAHMMITLLMAGQHTSSATGAWGLLHIAANPKIGEALYQEQVKHFSTPDGKLRSMTYEELRALPMMDAVIRETLRMHPPIHSIMRYVRDDVAIPGSLAAPSKDRTYIVPKGNYVLASPIMSQMDPKVWKDADKFEPYRWADPEGVAAQAYKTYVDENGEKVDYGFGAVSKGTESPYQPFGAGKHRCIGEQFAYLQLGTILATIIRHLELQIDKVPEENYHTMITMPKTPRSIAYRRRV